ncbi:SMI1-KNR4 cell-wall [compost metagenome]
MSVKQVAKGIEIINLHESYCDFAGAKDETLIALAEKTLDLKFPDDYRLFLQILGCGDIGGREFFGVIDSDFINLSIPDAVWITLQERVESNLPNSYIIISDTGDGSYIVLNCIESDEDKVMIWTPGVKSEDMPFEPYYSDFGTFFYDQIINLI